MGLDKIFKIYITTRQAHSGPLVASKTFFFKLYGLIEHILETPDIDNFFTDFNNNYKKAYGTVFDLINIDHKRTIILVTS